MNKLLFINMFVLLASTSGLRAQTYISPHLGASLDKYIGTNQSPIAIDGDWSGVYPILGIEVGQFFGTRSSVSTMISYSWNERSTTSQFLHDPVLSVRYHVFNISFTYCFKFGYLDFFTGPNFSHVRAPRHEQLYTGWVDSHLDANNSFGILIGSGLNIKKWKLRVSVVPPLKVFESNALVDDLFLMSLTLSREMQI
jgi:hypothetical protein